MASYANNLYVLIEIDDKPSDIFTRTYNLALYQIRYDTGYILKVEYFGGVGL